MRPAIPPELAQGGVLVRGRDKVPAIDPEATADAGTCVPRQTIGSFGWADATEARISTEETRVGTAKKEG